MEDPLIYPTPAELDVLAAVCHDGEKDGLMLSEIHEWIGRYRNKMGLRAPGLTTVSTQIGSLVKKKLLKAVADSSATKSAETRKYRGRRGIRSGSRTPSRYKPPRKLGKVLEPLLYDVARVYPEQQHDEALVDFAIALDIPKKKIQQLKRFLASDDWKHD